MSKVMPAIQLERFRLPIQDYRRYIPTERSPLKEPWNLEGLLEYQRLGYEPTLLLESLSNSSTEIEDEPESVDGFVNGGLNDEGIPIELIQRIKSRCGEDISDPKTRSVSDIHGSQKSVMPSAPPKLERHDTHILSSFAVNPFKVPSSESGGRAEEGYQEQRKVSMGFGQSDGGELAEKLASRHSGCLPAGPDGTLGGVSAGSMDRRKQRESLSRRGSDSGPRGGRSRRLNTDGTSYGTSSSSLKTFFHGYSKAFRKSASPAPEPVPSILDVLNRINSITSPSTSISAVSVTGLKDSNVIGNDDPGGGGEVEMEDVPGLDAMVSEEVTSVKGPWSFRSHDHRRQKKRKGGGSGGRVGDGCRGESKRWMDRDGKSDLGFAPSSPDLGSKAEVRGRKESNDDACEMEEVDGSSRELGRVNIKKLSHRSKRSRTPAPEATGALDKFPDPTPGSTSEDVMITMTEKGVDHDRIGKPSPRGRRKVSLVQYVATKRQRLVNSERARERERMMLV